MLDMLTKICQGKGKMEDLDVLEELAVRIQDTSLCALGQTAPNPILTTLRYFRDEYIEHIRDKKCRAGVCKSLLKFEINPEKCTGCTVCAIKCPVKAISGEKKKPHKIDQNICIKCGVCYDACRFNAIKSH